MMIYFKMREWKKCEIDLNKAIKVILILQTNQTMKMIATRDMLLA